MPEGRAWGQALMHGELRNVFAHAGGRVKEDNKKIRKYFASNNGKLSFGVDGKRLRITMAFCMDGLENIEELMAGVHKVGIARIEELKQRK